MGYRSKAQVEEGQGRASDRAFGTVLRDLRTQKQLTQERVAWETGMSRVYISETERGLREPSLTTILRLSRALGISAAEMMAAVEDRIASEPRPSSLPTEQEPG